VTLAKQGQGQLVYISIPLGLGIDQRPTAILGLLMRELVAGLVPIKVHGEVEWALNKLEDGGWAVTLLNNRGVIKPQHGILPTEHDQRQAVRISTSFAVKSAREWMTDSTIEVNANGTGSRVSLIVPAGGVRIVEIR
jgi:hypothetical protein